MHFSAFVGVQVGVQMIDSARVEAARPANDPVDFVAFAQEKLRQVGTILEIQISRIIDRVER
jgi:hypothetical protein